MLFTDSQAQRTAFASKFPKNPDLSKSKVSWQFSKYFAFPDAERPRKKLLAKERMAAQRFITEHRENEAIAALMHTLKPKLLGRVKY